MVALSAANIAEAGQLVEPLFRNTPQFHDPVLDQRLGRELVLKVETLNPLGSFKGRGASYFVRGLEPGREVVCASAGNFGQGIAYAAAARGIPVTVFTAENANAGKVARMRSFGADVKQFGADFDVAKDAAREYAAADGRLFVEDGEAPAIAEGAGTIGVELVPLDLDTLLVPVGNGALIAGIGCYLKAHSAWTRVIGVCAAGAPAMLRSWHDRTPVTTDSVDTMADGIAVRVPVPAAVGWMLEYVDDMLAVEEATIGRAMRLLRETTGQLVEPSAAAGIAALLDHEIPGERTGTIITGRNYLRETG
ncbi:threonine ammonia-lyase [Amycolatopsis magusensis]|uniref:Threonine dehydratase n=1 Tax=Amycolatopsis magusensis TaxID=882444 RepID=A0ABS4Q0T4_9PSEU|nr:pyridoxal-phosphate dependent enzyme [Amycolatopsis magusensis]MBP2185188.1 threonine dehydratase [Amycolatopsis magusensis]